MATTENAPFSPHAQGRQRAGPHTRQPERERQPERKRDRCQDREQQGGAREPGQVERGKDRRLHCHQDRKTPANDDEARQRERATRRCDETIGGHAAEAGEDQHPGQHQGEAGRAVVQPKAGLLDQVDFDEQETEAERGEVDQRPQQSRRIAAKSAERDKRHQQHYQRDHHSLRKHRQVDQGTDLSLRKDFEALQDRIELVEAQHRVEERAIERDR